MPPTYFHVKLNTNRFFGEGVQQVINESKTNQEIYQKTNLNHNTRITFLSVGCHFHMENCKVNQNLTSQSQPGLLSY